MTNRKKHFSQKVVVITGGSSGIGLAVAKKLALQGANLVIIGREKEKLDRARAVLEEAAQGQSLVLTFATDVSDKEQIASVMEKTGKWFGRIDVLINCAGIITCGRFADQPVEELEKSVAVNYMGAVYASKAAWPYLKKAKGHLSFVSSIAGYIGLVGHSSYAPAKFALSGLAECLRMEGKQDGISVSIIYPPDTDTPMLRYERKHSLPETMALSKRIKTLTAEHVAAIYLRGIANGKFAIYCTTNSRLLRWFSALFPGLFHTLTSRIVQKVTKDATAQTVGM